MSQLVRLWPHILKSDSLPQSLPVGLPRSHSPKATASAPRLRQSTPYLLTFPLPLCEPLSAVPIPVSPLLAPAMETEHSIRAQDGELQEPHFIRVSSPPAIRDMHVIGPSGYRWRIHKRWQPHFRKEAGEIMDHNPISAGRSAGRTAASSQLHPKLPDVVLRGFFLQ